MYSWMDVASRTERVYQSVLDGERIPIIERLRRYYGCGVWAGKLFCCVIVCNYLMSFFWEWLYPKEDIDIVPSFDMDAYRELTN